MTVRRNLLGRLAAVAAVGVTLGTAAMTVGAASASASGTTPSINNSTASSGRFNPSTVQAIRSAGSDTTFYMMQSISDLYNQAALYGCTLASDDETCTTADDANTDDTDNWSRTEVQTGIDAIGSSAGLSMLCGYSVSGNSTYVPAEMRVDFARSSTNPTAKAGNPCTGTSGLTGMAYATDGVPAVDFPTLNPAIYGATVKCVSAFLATCAANAANDGWNASTQTVELGPVAAGWLPGDNPAGPYSGTAFTNLPNNDQTANTSSTAYRIWCGGANKITDWGQLTDLTSGQAVGSGTPIGVPIQVWGVNPGSGTLSVFNGWVATGAVAPDAGCAKNATTPTNGAPGVGNASDVALENNSAQLATLAGDDSGVTTIPGFTPPETYGSGIAGEAAEVSASLYYMSYGVANANNYASSTVITVPGSPSGTKCQSATTSINGVAVPDCASYAASLLSENNISPSPLAMTTTIKSRQYPTQRFLYNAYLSTTVRASTASFLNWICDDNDVFQKATDNNTGQNYDSELSYIIDNEYGFQRIADNTPSSNVGYNQCNLISSVSTKVDPSSQEMIQGQFALGSTTVTLNTSVTTPYGIGASADQPISGAGIPAGTYIVSDNSGVLTLSQATTSSSAGEPLYVTGALQYNQE